MLLFHGYITLGKLLTLSKPWFSPQQIGCFGLFSEVGTVGTPNTENDPVTTVTNKLQKRDCCC